MNASCTQWRAARASAVLATGLTACEQKKKANTVPAAAPAEGGATPPAETPPANP